eukprot:1156350-Pelagomonas_calceolata.AAC.25
MPQATATHLKQKFLTKSSSLLKATRQPYINHLITLKHSPRVQRQINHEAKAQAYPLAGTCREQRGSIN